MEYLIVCINLTMALICFWIMRRHSMAKALLIAVVAFIMPVMGLVLVAMIQFGILIKWKKED